MPKTRANAEVGVMSTGTGSIISCPVSLYDRWSGILWSSEDLSIKDAFSVAVKGRLQ